MGTFTNSEDPDKMPHNVAFHQSRVYTVWFGKKDLQKFFLNYNPTTLDMCNGLSQSYCIISDGSIHQNTKD